MIPAHSSSVIREHGGRFWREVSIHTWRYLRVTWRLVLGMAILVPVIVLVSTLAVWAFGGRESFDLSPESALASMIMGSLYALAFAAMSFAQEHEHKTESFLRSLPCRTGALIAGVFLAGILGTALTTVCSLILTAGTAPFVGHRSVFSFPWPYEAVMGLWYWIVLAAAFLAWGIFFSLIVRRVIWASVLAAAVAYLVDLAIVLLLSPDRRFTWERAGELALVRLLPVAVIVAVDVGLIRGWLRPSPTGEATIWPRRRDRIIWRPSARLARYFAMLLSPLFRPRPIPDMRRPVGDHLLWLQDRQSGALPGVMRMVASLLVLTGLSLWGIAWWFGHEVKWATPLVGLVESLGIFLPIGIIGVMGIWMFGPDGWRGTGQFLAVQPVSPGKIWLSRQRWGLPWFLIWLLIYAIWTGLLLPSLPGEWGIRDAKTGVSYGLVFAMGLYAAGQLTGMYAPSMFHAIVLALGWVFVGLSLPIMLFPVGPDVLIPGAGVFIPLVVFVVAALGQTRLSLRRRLEGRPPDSWKMRFFNPVVWAFLVIWGLWPWARVLLIPKGDEAILRRFEQSRNQFLAEQASRNSHEALEGFNRTAQLADLVRRSPRLSALTGSTEQQDPQALRDFWNQFVRSQESGDILQIVAELPKTSYTDPYQLVVTGHTHVRTKDDYRSLGLYYPMLAGALESLAAGATQAGALEDARRMLVASACVRWRAERTYPHLHGIYWGWGHRTGWQRWADNLWAWGCADGQTAESVRSMLRELQGVEARERMPTDHRLLSIYEYWKDEFLRDAPYGMGLAGSRVAWWPTEMWVFSTTCRLLPGDWQLYQIRLARLAATYQSMAEEYDFRGTLPWDYYRRMVVSDWPEKSFRSGTAWNADLAVKSVLDSAFYQRLEQDLHVRAACLRLAIAAFRLEHGRYPDRLEELVPEDLLEIPLVPGAGRPFRLYFPQKVFGDTSLPASPILVAPGDLRDGVAFPLEHRSSEAPRDE